MEKKKLCMFRCCHLRDPVSQKCLDKIARAKQRIKERAKLNQEKLLAEQAEENKEST